MYFGPEFNAIASLSLHSMVPISDFWMRVHPKAKHTRMDLPHWPACGLVLTELGKEPILRHLEHAFSMPHNQSVDDIARTLATTIFSEPFEGHDPATLREYFTCGQPGLEHGRLYADIRNTRSHRESGGCTVDRKDLLRVRAVDAIGKQSTARYRVYRQQISPEYEPARPNIVSNTSHTPTEVQDLTQFPIPPWFHQTLIASLRLQSLVTEDQGDEHHDKKLLVTSRSAARASIAALFSQATVQLTAQYDKGSPCWNLEEMLRQTLSKTARAYLLLVPELLKTVDEGVMVRLTESQGEDNK